MVYAIVRQILLATNAIHALLVFITFRLVKVNLYSYCINSSFIIILNISYLILFHFSACNCNTQGSFGNTCNDNGKCSCKANVINDKCDKCTAGYWNFPACEGKNCFYTFLLTHYINEIFINLRLIFVAFLKF